MTLSRASMSWDRSLPSVAAVRTVVARSYGFEPTDVTLVRSFVNDVFRIDTASSSYALKIYRTGRFSAEEVRWEQEFAGHLVSAGIPVAAGVPLAGGGTVGTLEAPEGPRPFAMTGWLPGRPPQPPWTEELYRSVGAALARLHGAADSFTSGLERRPMRSGDEPEQVVAALIGDPARQDLVRRAATAARGRLEQLARDGLHRGFLHGDPSLDNLHLAEDGSVLFYDLDLAGPGWQVEDLSGALSTEFSEPFLDGYVSQRPLAGMDLEALPWLRILAHIDNLRFHLVDKPALQGTSTLAEGWVERGFEALAAALQDAR